MNKVGIVSCVQNFDLFKKTVKFFPAEYSIFVVDGSTGFYGLDAILFSLEKLKLELFDWVILIDEDVVFLDSSLMKPMLEYMHSNEIAAVGVPDGGMVTHRFENPYAFNSFFVILNFKLFRSRFSSDKVRSNQFVIKDEFKGGFRKEIRKSKYDTMSLFEPYYCLFLWMRREGLTLHDLHTKIYSTKDKLSTVVLDFLGNPLLVHTWKARRYNTDSENRDRIDDIINMNITATKHENYYVVIRNKDSILKRFFSKFFG